MKEYLKMKDVFPSGVSAHHGGDYNGWSVVEHFNGGGIDESGDGGFHKKTADYVAHAINSHDELVAEVEMLRDMVLRMQHYLDMAGEYPEKESENPLKQWLFDAIDFTKE